MAEKTKATLILDFETGDTPDGSNFKDLIESSVNLANTTAQSMTGGLTAPSLGATSVSAVNMKAGNVAVSGGVSAAQGEFGTLAVSGQSSFAGVSASTMVVTGILSAETVVATTIKTMSLDVSADAHIFGDLTVEGTLAASQTESGELYISATALASASATPVEFISNATADSTFLVNFTVSANRLIYKGAATRNFLAIANVGVEASQNNTQTELCIAVNSSAQPRTLIDANIGTSEVDLSVHGMVQLAPEDTVSLVINNDVGAARGYIFHHIILTVKD